MPGSGGANATCDGCRAPSVRMQDKLFTEARRVLQPAGVFRGMDSQPSLRFRLLHIGDTMIVLDPATLPERLTSAGFISAQLDTEPGRLGFVART